MYRASFKTISLIRAYSVDFFLKNLSLAGVLKNRSLITISVPPALDISSYLVILPAFKFILCPTLESLVLLEIIILDIDPIEANASPLNP